MSFTMAVCTIFLYEVIGPTRILETLQDFKEKIF